MKFIVDAQLPVRLARFLQASGYDTLHTKDLPRENATPDNEINTVSIQQNRILITKDVDFVNSFLTVQEPYKLLLITTGNINNSELESLFIANFQSVVELFKQHSYIEINRDTIIVHQ
jgi:predicted nuclease of predicted toxin-antitoxin system